MIKNKSQLTALIKMTLLTLVFGVLGLMRQQVVWAGECNIDGQGNHICTPCNYTKNIQGGRYCASNTSSGLQVYLANEDRCADEKSACIPNTGAYSVSQFCTEVVGGSTTQDAGTVSAYWSEGTAITGCFVPAGTSENNSCAANGGECDDLVGPLDGSGPIGGVVVGENSYLVYKSGGKVAKLKPGVCDNKEEFCVAKDSEFKRGSTNVEKFCTDTLGGTLTGYAENFASGYVAVNLKGFTGSKKKTDAIATETNGRLLGEYSTTTGNADAYFDSLKICLVSENNAAVATQSCKGYCLETATTVDPIYWAGYIGSSGSRLEQGFSYGRRYALFRPGLGNQTQVAIAPLSGNSNSCGNTALCLTGQMYGAAQFCASIGGQWKDVTATDISGEPLLAQDVKISNPGTTIYNCYLPAGATDCGNNSNANGAAYQCVPETDLRASFAQVYYNCPGTQKCIDPEIASRCDGLEGYECVSHSVAVDENSIGISVFALYELRANNTGGTVQYEYRVAQQNGDPPGSSQSPEYLKCARPDDQCIVKRSRDTKLEDIKLSCCYHKLDDLYQSNKPYHLQMYTEYLLTRDGYGDLADFTKSASSLKKMMDYCTANNFCQDIELEEGELSEEAKCQEAKIGMIQCCEERYFENSGNPNNLTENEYFNLCSYENMTVEANNADPGIKCHLHLQKYMQICLPDYIPPFGIGDSNLGSGDLNNLDPLYQNDSYLKGKSPGTIISTAVNRFVFPIAGIILFIMLIWGGVAIITASTTGQQNKIDMGKKRITAALIGFLILFASYWILQLVESVLGIGGVSG
jgi:hypothetical protein